MSLSRQFNNKAVSRDKEGREIKTFEDYRSARIRQADGSFSTFRAGKLIAKEDAPAKSQFHQATPIVTIVAEKEKENHVRKPLDVNAPSMKL